MNAYLELINSAFPLKEKNIGDYKKLKVSVMNFETQTFEAKGLGSVCYMKSSGMLGLMKMESLVITPTELDLPLYSLEFISVAGKVKFLVEVYDTLCEKLSLENLERTAKSHGELADIPQKPHWYDNLILEGFVAKEGKKAQAELLRNFSKEHLKTYLALDAKETTDMQNKKEKTLFYVDGLLKNGGPATDVFKKSLGAEKTAEFLHKVMFSIN